MSSAKCMFFYFIWSWYFRYDPGGGLTAFIFMWRVPDHRSDNEKMTMSIAMLEKIRPNLPEYHTRAMKGEFKSEISRLGVDIPPHIIRFIYKRLTLDSTADDNPAIDERIKLALSSGDFDLVLDLRHLNKGRPPDTFKDFFSTLNGMIEEWAAADERRHGIAHMSQFLSVSDIISQVKKNLPPNVPIPSESTVELAFAPKNVTTASARYYTGKVNLKHQVQSRQLRKPHIDAHYCAAQYKYMREMAVKFKEEVLFLSCDDKAKVMVGEPSLPIASGVRGKRSIAPTNISLSALDHDVNQKGAVVPSVILDIDIPDAKDLSFYQGQVVVTLKDSVFEPSGPNRFTVEVIKYWQSLSQEQRANIKILMLYTDGGPEHRTTFESVKIALIHLFRTTNVELLIALRTAPGQSFINPVERVMSLINISLQNVAIQRPECSEEIEQALKSCSTLETIRKKEALVREPWLQSIEEVKRLLRERIERCSLKGVQFKTMEPATEEELLEVNKTMQELDKDLDPSELQAKHIKSKKDYLSFKDKHCQERQYSFQVFICLYSGSLQKNLYINRAFSIAL